jgi:hypothetical protein
VIVSIQEFEMFEKGNSYTKSSLKSCLGCSASSLPHDLAATLFSTLGLAALIQRATSGQGTACLLSTVLRVCHKYLN